MTHTTTSRTGLSTSAAASMNERHVAMFTQTQRLLRCHPRERQAKCVGRPPLRTVLCAALQAFFGEVFELYVYIMKFCHPDLCIHNEAVICI